MGSGQLKTFRVSGSSMNPLLRDGDQISVVPESEYKVGDIVVAVHPIQSDLTIIKRIEQIAPDSRLRLRGTNPDESTDNFGLVDQSRIIGKMTAKLD